MLTDNLEVTIPIDADIIVLDRNDRIVMLVEVKIIESQEKAGKQTIVNYMISWMKSALAKMSEKNTVIPFAMFVDPEKIIIFKWDGVNLSEPICILNTGDILRHYEPEFGSKKIFESYLESLIDAWLRDLAYHWKSETPPASEQIAIIGLLEMIVDGTTKTEVQLGNFVYRDQFFDEHCYRS